MESYKNIEGDYYEKAHTSGHKAQRFMYNSREDYFIDFMNLKGNERVLDIGCGSGTFTRRLARKYSKAEFVGADISKKIVNYANKKVKKEKLKNLKFVMSGINKLKVKGKFDVVIVSHLIEHLDNPKGALLEVKKKMKKNGRLFITTPNYFSLWPLAEKVFDRTIAGEEYSLDEQHVSRFDNKSIKKIMKKTGFEIEKLKTLYIFSLEAGVISSVLANLFFKLDKALDFLPIGMIIYLEAKIK